MNRDIMMFILKWKGWLQSQGIRKGKWRKMIGKSFVDSGENKKYESGADKFVRTYTEMESKGLV